ncbi:hypothetical protein BX264_2889 [Streptomyces sp. 2333.5]|uniref:hypothetical protein n=1 Tax=unclassified Streptomyces TaxID=2593676 RepID=UPI000894261F|nr:MULTISPECIES: hypothetical protein [unclassified Streptomyces]PJJ02542.1 hypothetical protein BX264_2889 [Streptomyces sp. 2333.5]SED14900.1 hypothetical protein SAMN05428943_3029 [Streptomyces sp. 2314.4]SEE02421.1 hypothetical protein SAMN05428942_2992 [Streptomyces sp. 2112.2]
MLPVSIVQQIGLGVLFALAVVWTVGLTRMLRRGRYEAALWRDQQEMRARYAPRGRSARPGPEALPGGPELLGSVPRQTGPPGPPSECVQLSDAERTAFEGLVRQLTSPG